jgi:hypothetical protein
VLVDYQLSSLIVIRFQTRLFVTHGLLYLPHTDYVVMLGPDGNVLGRDRQQYRYHPLPKTEYCRVSVQ